MFVRNLFQLAYHRFDKKNPFTAGLLRGAMTWALLTVSVVGGIKLIFPDTHPFPLAMLSVIFVVLSLPLQDLLDRVLDPHKNRAKNELTARLKAYAAVFAPHFQTFLKLQKGHGVFRTRNGLEFYAKRESGDAFEGLHLTLSFDDSQFGVTYFLSEGNAPELVKHNWQVADRGTEVVLPEARLRKLDQLLPQTLAELLADERYVPAGLQPALVPMRGNKKDPHHLSGLTNLNGLRTGVNPWFNGLLDRVQSASAGLAPLLDGDDPAHTDLTNNLAPQLAAMLTMVHPLMRQGGTIFPELQQTLESLVGRLEVYHAAVQEKTAARLINDGTRVLSLSAAMPDPVLG